LSDENEISVGFNDWSRRCVDDDEDDAWIFDNNDSSCFFRNEEAVDDAAV
jgi:hypothetical protein